MRTLRHIAVLLQIFLLLVACHPAIAQTGDDLATLIQKVDQLSSRRLLKQAIPLAQQAVALAEQRGSDDPGLATALYYLAEIYRNEGRYSEAEPLHKRALEIREKILTNDDSNVSLSVIRLADVYRALSRNAELHSLYDHWLALHQRSLGSQAAHTGKALNDLGEALQYWKNYTDAALFFQRALAVNEQELGRNDPEVARSLQGLAEISRFQGLTADAERYYKRVLLIQELVFGADNTKVADTLSALAGIAARQRRFSDAELLYRRALPIQEKALPPETFALALQSFANFYMGQARYGEAEKYFKQAVAIMQRAVPPSDPRLSNALVDLAQSYRAQRRFPEAESLIKRALFNEEKAYGPNDIRLARLLRSLANLDSDQGRFDESEQLLKRALAIAEKLFGPDHYEVALALQNLGGHYRYVGYYRDRASYAKAEPLLKRSLAIFLKWYSPDDPVITNTFYQLLELYTLEENWSGAVEFLRRIRDTDVAIARHANEELGKAPITDGKSRSANSDWLIQMGYRLYRGPVFSHDVQDEMFVAAQWALRTPAATSLAQMAAREVSGKFAQLVRDRQDLASEWLELERSLLYSSDAPNQRDIASDQTHRARMVEIDQQLATMDARLVKDLPQYAAYANPEPLSIVEAQALLGDDEALVLFHDIPGHYRIPNETYGWVITRTSSRWFRAPGEPKVIADDVRALRCGLDYEGAWGPRSRCPELLKVNYTSADESAGKPLPFDLVRAHSLYKTLFGPIEDLIKGKQLLIVPSGPLAQLPFQVLLTAAPGSALPTSAAGYRDAAWLVRSHALTVLPAVSSLKALRAYARESHASEAFVGFGDPLLDGDPVSEQNPAKRDAIIAAARLARTIQCDSMPQSTVASIGVAGGTLAIKQSEGRLADLTEIRLQMPLPETALELCKVAMALGVDPNSHVYLGAKATETVIKRLSSEGTLAKYRIVQFATHGAVAGDISRTSEPGLILTPPDQPTQTDDGYLGASEVAALKLDADWVILSACNTAAGGAEGAEALSGLARAFFYAGARALLVSHWSVYSDATVNLITKAVSELQASPKIGRAEALRRSMLSMIDSGKSAAKNEKHPAFWAPFVLVGEGTVTEATAAISVK